MIGNWDIRTLYRSGNIARTRRETTSRGIDIIGISKTHLNREQGRVQLVREKPYILEQMTTTTGKELAS